MKKYLKLEHEGKVLEIDDKMQEDFDNAMKTRVLAFYNLGVEMEHLKEFSEATIMYKKAITALDKANKKYKNRFDVDIPPLIDRSLLFKI